MMPAPLSAELIAHYAGLHPCPDDDPMEILCPCGDTVALLCPTCREPVFFSTRPATWCEHARELWRADR
jgi:hypothetical protein